MHVRKRNWRTFYRLFIFINRIISERERAYWLTIYASKTELFILVYMIYLAFLVSAIYCCCCCCQFELFTFTVFDAILQSIKPTFDTNAIIISLPFSKHS